MESSTIDLERLRALYPGRTDTELHEAFEAFDRYLYVALLVWDRLTNCQGGASDSDQPN
jgi:hypothetical protein